MNTINFRIKNIIEYYNLNVNSFSKKIGIDNNVTIGNIVNTRLNKPSFDIILKILQTFENIDASWLILGKGEMIKEKNDHSNSNIDNCPLCKPKDQLIKTQEKLITSLEEQLEYTRKLCQHKKED